MGFIDSYKHLEKLSGEVLNDDRRLSAYIDEMANTPKGPRYVPSWNEDFKRLKHYRWVRNQISHEPNCNESNMCEHDDELWLDNFYERIMNQTDPLAQYRHLNYPQSKIYAPKTQPIQNDCSPKIYEDDYQPPKNNRFGIGLFVAVFVLLGILIWLVSKR
ncbi:MAG: hypothetical protein K5664_04375 [Firmicutes bacterium]|nr:hypothetical protein [Bacillota bacterium]